MYSERVGYANKYVPHANKALRSFNMYLNVRTQPLPSRLSRMASTIGLGSLFPPSTPPPTQQQLQTRERTTSLPSSSSRESSPYGRRNLRGGERSEVNPIIPQIPPSSNPRGELIFSSFVHKEFREGYERYRESYEKRMQVADASRAGRGLFKRMIMWIVPDRMRGAVYGSENVVIPSGIGTPATGGGGGVDTPVFGESPGGGGNVTYSPGSARGRGLSSTPSGSRKSSPAPVGASIGKKGSRRRAGAKLSRQGTPLLEIVEGINTSTGGGTPGGSGSGENAFSSSVEMRRQDSVGDPSGSNRGDVSMDGEGGVFEIPLLGTDTPPMMGRGYRRRRKGSALGDLG
ncbi:hypothetical protein FRC20_004499 [Serendipita sp. 405]|nr:hypothetical protein FRC20_004499 [Serendipita sp. 405]